MFRDECPMHVLPYIISLNHTILRLWIWISLNIKYINWERSVLYPHTKTLCHAIANNNKSHCSKNTFLTLKHRWSLNGQYSKCFLVILRVFKSNSFLKKIYLLYFWLYWVFIAVHGLSLVVVSRGYSLLWCEGFSLWWLLLLRSTGSKCMGFSSCGMWAQ